MSSDKQQRDRDSANADAESIVNQIKKLRAGTSVDDEDRINTLTNLQHLADQLLDMVGVQTRSNYGRRHRHKTEVSFDELIGILMVLGAIV